MNSQIYTQDKRAWTRMISAVLIFACVSLLLPVGPMPGAGAHASPGLVVGPDRMVAVIVQKTVNDDRVEKLVARLGGTVTKDLHIIHGFAAELRAKDIPQLARTEGVRWVSLDAPVQQAATTASTLTWATGVGGLIPTNGFTNAANMADSALGPNSTFGYGSKVKGSFTGFAPEDTPGNAITKVEIALRVYTSAQLSGGDDPHVMIYVGGKQVKNYGINHALFAPFAGAANVGTLYVDFTPGHKWMWADFDSGVEVVIDQSMFKSGHIIYYDAVGLRVTSAPGTDTSAGAVTWPSTPNAPVDPSKLLNVYNQVIGATRLWNGAGYLQGKNVVVAVVDSGFYSTNDLKDRVKKSVNFNLAYHDSADRYGHGTFVAGIIGGNGAASKGKYIGVAPKATLLNVRVSDDQGMSTESDVIKALQWVNDNQAKYNIRVVNLSLNSSQAESYHTNPLDAACEILWFNGIVVVTSAGNNGTSTLYPPANDPFVITVGATDDMGTVSLTDDIVASFSAYGTLSVKNPNGTTFTYSKPDLVAPGKNIIANLPENDKINISNAHAANRIDKNYFKMSGTSMSAPMVSGAVALLLQDEPNLTPDQVKYRLKATANKTWAGYSSTTAGAGYLDIYAAVNGTTTQAANTGIQASHLLWTGPQSLAWGSVSWDSVSWDSVSWDSVSWDSVSWDSDYWGQ